MKALIRVMRRTEYASIVDMPQEKYDRLQAALQSDDRVERKNAEKTLNGMIDTRDWQDDDLLYVEEFEPFIQCGKETMNGTTTIDATLNPCSAECDRHTYGWAFLNVSTYGKRLSRLHVGRLTVDVYRGGWKVFTAMGGGAGTARYWNLFTPLGSVTWITRKANNNLTGG